MNLNTNEIDVLRSLSEKYMGYANLPIHKEKIKLWRALNSGKMQRPMVCMDQLPTNEIMCKDLTAVISDPFWRSIEEGLRFNIYKWEHFPVDMVLEPYISVPISTTCSGYGVTLDVDVRGEKDSTAKGMYFNSVIESEEDVEKIKDMEIVYDKSLTKEHEDEAKIIFKDTAPILMRNHIGSHLNYGFYLGLWDVLSEYMGVENSYINVLTEPEFVHAAMKRMTESTISAIEKGNELKIHDIATTYCHCSHIFTDELMPDFNPAHESVSQNTWAFGLAQIFTGISPEMFEEFEFPYVEKLSKYFGMLYYGCCDRLDDRLEIVKRLKNVKKISCSPWSDRKSFAEKIGTEIVMSNKPSPAFLATDSFDKEAVRKDLQLSYDLAKANNANLEYILKDISTVRKDPKRLTEWAEIAMEVAQG